MSKLKARSSHPDIQVNNSSLNGVEQQLDGTALPHVYNADSEVVNEQQATYGHHMPPAVSLNPVGDQPLDHFTVRNGVKCAGSHVLIDLWGGNNLDSLELMEKTMREMVKACKATLLHIHLHHFTPQGGISGVAVLAESHISVHTWPECGFAAFDVFMCGDAEPLKSVEVVRRAFEPTKLQTNEELRGVFPGN